MINLKGFGRNHSLKGKKVKLPLCLTIRIKHYTMKGYGEVDA
jgi:hypothetical protein